MDSKSVIDGLLMYLGLIVLLTFHEFGHAWTAWKCGDNTARMQGRVSLNPLVHIDLIGTVLLPLLMIFLPSSVGRFIIGWAKPVPVNPSNLRNGRMDDILVTLAGPWMNLILAVILMALARLGYMVHSGGLVDLSQKTAHLSLLLCFFNLIPIPPLDGSQVVRSLIGLSFEAYYRMARYGMFILILLLQLPAVQATLAVVTNKSQNIIAGWVGLPGAV